MPLFLSVTASSFLLKSLLQQDYVDTYLLCTGNIHVFEARLSQLIIHQVGNFSEAVIYLL